MNNTLNTIFLIAKRNPVRLSKIVLRRLGLKIDTGMRYGTEKEMLALRKYASLSTIGIVEIGVLDGGTTREMALVANVPIYGIDPIIPDSMEKTLIGHEDLIKKNLKFYKKFYFIKDYSFNVIKKWHSSFDLIWIDGDHQYEACKKDFDDWFPHLTHGGVISFHDSAPVISFNSKHIGYPGPIRLVSELKKDPRLTYLETIDSITFFKKI